MVPPGKRTDMPPNVWSCLYIDRSLVSNRTRNCALSIRQMQRMMAEVEDNVWAQWRWLAAAENSGEGGNGGSGRGGWLWWAGVRSKDSSLLWKSMKHCSQGSSSLVNNENTGNQWNTALKGAALVSKMQTLAITLSFLEHRLKEHFYLGFFNKEKWLAWRSTRSPARRIFGGWQVLRPLIIMSIRGTGLMRRTIIAQIMMSNYWRADILVKFTRVHVSSRFGPPPTLATLPW